MHYVVLSKEEVKALKLTLRNTSREPQEAIETETT